MPPPPQALAERSPNTARANAQKKSSAPAKTNQDHVYTVAELSDVNLDGEEDEKVPIFDTCDDIRKKINEHLKHPGVTKAGLSREVTDLLPKSKVTPKNMDQLLRMKGPLAGGHDDAFYAGYVFFENSGVKQDKKKTAKRQKMEDAWAHEGGLPRIGSQNMGITCMAGERPRLDYLGHIQIKGAPSARSGPIFRKKLGK